MGQGNGNRSVLRAARLRARHGFALEATLMIMVLFGVLILAAVGGIGWAMRTTSTDIQGTRVNYATEGGAESVMASLEAGMADGFLDDAELAALAPPSMPGITFETFAAAREGSPFSQPVTEGPYAGLFSLNQRINITVQARDGINNRSRSIVTVNAQAIPVFQMGVFYQDDLEIHPGAAMVFEGWIHTNANLYLSANNSTYRSIITTPDSVFWQRKDSNQRLNGVFINNNAAVATALNFDSRSTTAAQFVANSETMYNSRLKSGASGATELRLPLPTGMAPTELVAPRSMADNAQVQEVKFAWRADWHITVPMNAAGFAIAASNLCETGAGNPTIRDGSNGAGTSVPPVGTGSGDCGGIFQLTNAAFHEGRENTMVDVVNIRMDRLRTWINGSVGDRRTRIMYITFVRTDGLPITRYPAVRLQNGSQLQGPITIATDRPLYVWGNFNSTAPWFPASLASDALTFLSACWVDANQLVFIRRDACASGTTMNVYAAVAAGHSATTCDWQRAGCAAPNYGGGLENFPRFLENWSGRTLLYRGSLVSLFTSQYARLQNWNWRAYYSAPNRDWRFDTRFNDPANMPPGTPMVGSVFQVAYRPVY
ncbi:MAG: hypothetical protein JNL44_12345 [Gemmatimonadetes bacterium]|nr:hypothetical protein [Gemmatimonadota bacterium]